MPPLLNWTLKRPCRLALLPNTMDCNQALMWCAAVFPEVDALPGPEGQSSLRDRNGEIDGGQRSPNVGWHVVFALRDVREQRVAVRNQSAEKTFEIPSDVRICILLDEQRSRCVANLQSHQPGLESILRDPGLHLVGEFIKSAPPG